MDKDDKELIVDSFTMVSDALENGEIKKIRDKEEKKDE